MCDNHKKVIQSLLNKEVIVPNVDFDISSQLINCFIEEYQVLTATKGNLRKKEKVFAAKLAAKSLIDYKLSQKLKPKEGFLYIIENPAWPGAYKIGMTWYPYKRLSQYQTYSPLRDFRLKHWSFWPNKREAERVVHEFLKDKINYEWAYLNDQQLVELQQLLNNKFGPIAQWLEQSAFNR